MTKKPNNFGPMVTALTKEFSDEFCKYIANGMSFDDACLMTYKDRGTVNHWLQAGQMRRKTSVKNLPIYKRFAEDYRRAQLTYSVLLEQALDKVSKDNWTAIAWKLERKRPETYHRDGADMYAMRKEELALRVQHAKANLEILKLEQEKLKVETEMLKKTSDRKPLTKEEIDELFHQHFGGKPGVDPTQESAKD